MTVTISTFPVIRYPFSSSSSLLRQHHRLWDLHLSKGGPGALRLSGFGLGGLGPGGLHRRSGLPLLRGTGRHHPQIWGRLLLRHRDIWWSDRVSTSCCSESVSSLLSQMSLKHMKKYLVLPTAVMFWCCGVKEHVCCFDSWEQAHLKVPYYAKNPFINHFSCQRTPQK